MATETEKNGPAAETKDIKDVKEMKDALKDETPPDNKQDEASKESANEKKEEANKSKNGEYTRNYFTDTLIAISAAFKVNVGMNISLREYCRWVVKYREYAEEMNKRNIV